VSIATRKDFVGLVTGAQASRQHWQGHAKVPPAPSEKCDSPKGGCRNLLLAMGREVPVPPRAPAARYSQNRLAADCKTCVVEHRPKTVHRGKSCLPMLNSSYRLAARWESPSGDGIGFPAGLVEVERGSTGWKACPTYSFNRLSSPTHGLHPFQDEPARGLTPDCMQSSTTSSEYQQ
jgi:hypothetical protein